MAFNENILTITLDGTGVEIPALSVNDGYSSYLLTGAVVAIGNYAIVPTGVPQLGTTYIFEYNGTLDITTNGTTFAIFGSNITQAQLSKKFTITCIYNGSSWDNTLVLGLNQSNVISPSNIGNVIVNSNIVNNSIDLSTKALNLSLTNAKIANDTIDGDQKLVDGSVTQDKLATDSVSTVKIVDSNVTNAKLATMADQTIKGNISGGATNPSDISISTLVNDNAWGLSGNSGTVAGTNFIGTTDNVDLVFKRNNVISGGIDNTNSWTYFGFGACYLASDVLISAFGNSAASSSTGNNLTAIGFNSLLSSTGSHKTALGYYSDVNGADNYTTSIGEATQITGNYGIALGYGAVAPSLTFALPDNVTDFKFRGNSFTLPSADGSAKAALVTDGSKVLSFGKIIDSDTYTPSLTNGTNVASSTAYLSQWSRIGNVVTVSGKVTINTTATGTTEMGMSLPVASNFGNEYELGGTAASEINSSTPVRILADAANNRASFSFDAGTTGIADYSFTFTYSVI
jgi:hypothetical protein